MHLSLDLASSMYRFCLFIHKTGNTPSNRLQVLIKYSLQWSRRVVRHAPVDHDGRVMSLSEGTQRRMSIMMWIRLQGAPSRLSGAVGSCNSPVASGPNCSWGSSVGLASAGFAAGLYPSVSGGSEPNVPDRVDVAAGSHICVLNRSTQ